MLATIDTGYDRCCTRVWLKVGRLIRRLEIVRFAISVQDFWRLPQLAGRHP